MGWCVSKDMKIIVQTFLESKAKWLCMVSKVKILHIIWFLKRKVFITTQKLKSKNTLDLGWKIHPFQHCNKLLRKWKHVIRNHLLIVQTPMYLRHFKAKPQFYHYLCQSLYPWRIEDRVSQKEARAVSFIVEHILAFSQAPTINGLAMPLSRDAKALDELTVCSKTASGKLREGVSFVMTCGLHEEKPISLNLAKEAKQEF